MNKLDILSKLLASENITLLEVNEHTASFDIETRTLRIPSNIKITDNQKMLMVLHEVGHALYTTEKYIKNIEEYNKINFEGYMNVVEDARIERLIKNKFPGSNKDFVIGYDEFNKDDFFGIASSDLNSLKLIDRINLHFKLGSRVGIKFNPIEYVFVTETGIAITEEQVFDIAKRVYEYAASQSHKELRDPNGENDDGEGDDEDPKFGENIEFTEDKRTDGTQNENAIPIRTARDKSEVIAPEAETQSSFDDALQDRSSENSSIQTVDMVLLNTVTVIPPKEILEDLLTVPKRFFRTEEYRKNKASNSRIVDKMVADFERKKAAESRKLTKVSKSGEIDTGKLFEYKIADDIFKRYNISVDAKNHGILILLDWSASMYSCMSSLINQTIILVEFCRRVKIKFEVYAFRENKNRKIEKFESAKQTGLAHANISTPIDMICWFNSNMRSSDVDTISNFLFSASFGHRMSLPNDPYIIRKYSLDSTPLIAGSLFIRDRIPIFKQKNNLQKITTIIITDGEDTDTKIFHRVDSNRFAVKSRFGTTTNLVDKQINKTYKLISGFNNQMIQSAVVRSISDRYDYVTTVGFFIASQKTDLRRFIMKQHKNFYIDYSALEAIWGNVKKFGVSDYVYPGYKNFFVIPCSDDSNELDLSKITSSMDSKQISRSFVTANKSLNRGKVLASKFVDAIA